MTLPRYPSYKDSGVEWLGEVPGHWEVIPLSRTASDANSMFIDGDWIESKDLSDDGIRYITSGNVGDGFYKEQGQGFISESTFAALNCIEVFPGDVLISRLNLPIGRTCIVPNLSSRIVTCVDNVIVRPNQSFDRRFFVYVLSSKSHFANMENLARGTTMQRISRSTLGRVRFAFPLLDEQAQIATFLDRETAKIDVLVAEQRRLMELLKEKRQAVISHAVTRGLNPDAPLKPSGIEWLGDVPAHWRVMPLKYVVELRSGGTPSKANLAYWDGDVPWASSKDLKVEALADTQDHITQEAIADGAASLIREGSLLIVVRGMILIHTFPVVKTLTKMAINQDIKAVVPVPGVDVDFLAWLLRGSSRESLGRVDEAAHGTKVLRLEDWTSLPLPIPPIEEQLKIVGRIVLKLQELDTLTTEAQHAIDLLQERRTALISAAVTGQIDVRCAVAS